MNILIACEFSGVVRNEFVSRGHDAFSCDLLPSETERPDGWDGHYRGDVFELLANKSYSWGMLIAFPPCTYLARSGARWWPERLPEQERALDFVRALLALPIDRIALENPIGAISTRIRKPDQIIQPWQFGHGEVKATCLWLKNLPLLVPTLEVVDRKPRTHFMAPSPTRGKDRSRTLLGIAAAMAGQWGSL